MAGAGGLVWGFCCELRNFPGWGGWDPSVARSNGRLGSGLDPNQSCVADTDKTQLPLGCPWCFLTSVFYRKAEAQVETRDDGPR